MGQKIAYSETSPLISEICSEEDLRYNFEQLQNVVDIIGNPYIDNGIFSPVADPNAVAIRFKLDTVFGGAGPYTASATVYDAEGNAGDFITVRDVTGTFGRAVGNEWGFAVPIKINGLDYYEIRSLDINDSGGGGGGGADELVARYSGNPAGYLNSQLAATILDTATYDAGVHQAVYGAVSGNNVRLYTNMTGADGKVAVTAADYGAGDKDYLDVKLKNVGTTTFNATTHAKVYHDKTATGTNGLALESYILFADLPGTVRVSSGDTLAYLQDQFTPKVGTAPVGYDQCTIVSDGTVLQVWAPGSDADSSGRIGVSLESIAGATRVAWDSLTTDEKAAIGEAGNAENADTAGETVYVYRSGRGRVQPCTRVLFIDGVNITELIVPKWESDGGSGYVPMEETWMNTNSQSVDANKLLQGKQVAIESVSSDGAGGGGGDPVLANITYIDVESCG